MLSVKYRPFRVETNCNGKEREYGNGWESQEDGKKEVGDLLCRLKKRFLPLNQVLKKPHLSDKGNGNFSRDVLVKFRKVYNGYAVRDDIEKHPDERFVFFYIF